jgi:hypothetical protein
MELPAHWEEVYVPGSILVADETMVGWKGSTNIHSTFLLNKPKGEGVCLKTLVDGHTRVMTRVFEHRMKTQKKHCRTRRIFANRMRIDIPYEHTHTNIPVAQFVGYAMDSTATDVAAMRILRKEDPDILVLPYASHALSNLIKQTAKYFSWLDSPANPAAPSQRS